jgi:hypothetical protein
MDGYAHSGGNTRSSIGLCRHVLVSCPCLRWWTEALLWGWKSRDWPMVGLVTINARAMFSWRLSVCDVYFLLFLSFTIGLAITGEITIASNMNLGFLFWVEHVWLLDFGLWIKYIECIYLCRRSSFSKKTPTRVSKLYVRNCSTRRT